MYFGAMATHPTYSVHPGVQMIEDWIGALREKTGRSLEEWLAHIAKAGPKTELARREWLKKEHGLGTNSAWWLAERSVGKGSDEDTPAGYLRAARKYVDEMYSGGKLDLRPLHDRLIRAGLAAGKGVRICPCRTIVPFYREHVFAQIKPSTRTRIDFGLALGPLVKAKERLPARLIDTGGFAKKDRITHRIEIKSAKDIDDDLKRWLKRAYELDAP
jgi:hypothetical protein